jgi:hypothetical protein
MILLLAAFFCGGAAYFQHWLGYYRYPEMRCITLFMEKQGRHMDAHGVGADNLASESFDDKPRPKMNFITKHWRGEYSISRSFWLHGVLLGYLLLVLSCLLLEKTGISLGWLFLIVIGWQIGGVWRSAKREGGFWAGKYNASIGAILLLFMNNFTDTVKEQRHRPEIEHRHASSTPAAPPLIPADNKPSDTQPWKQVGEWNIRYDYLDSGDGTPSGCFMSRSYRNSALRIGVHGDNYHVIFTSENLTPRIENRKYYDLSLSFGKLTPWSIKAEAKTFASGNKFLVFRTSDQRFFAELVGSNSLTISQSGTPIFEFTVTGAKEALAAMLNCQEAHLRNANKSS